MAAADRAPEDVLAKLVQAIESYVRSLPGTTTATAYAVSLLEGLLSDCWAAGLTTEQVRAALPYGFGVSVRVVRRLEVPDHRTLPGWRYRIEDEGSCHD